VWVTTRQAIPHTSSEQLSQVRMDAPHPPLCFTAHQHIIWACRATPQAERVSSAQEVGEAQQIVQRLMSHERQLVLAQSQHAAGLIAVGEAASVDEEGQQTVADQLHALRAQLTVLTAQYESGQVRARFLPSPSVSPPPLLE
jgi:hypothetical protein